MTKPWPGMTAGFWKDPERYLETYWSRWPDVWVHGDWAYVDEDGFWFIHGRSDDTLKLAGKRVGPAEIESVLVGHPAVNEAAAIGVPHDVKGESVVCFAVLRPDFTGSDTLRTELIERVIQAMGRAIRPDRVLFVRELPKRAAPRSCAALSGPRIWARNRATCRRSRILAACRRSLRRPEALLCGRVISVHSNAQCAS